MSLLGGVCSGCDEFGKLGGSFGSGKIGSEFVGSDGIEALFCGIRSVVSNVFVGSSFGNSECQKTS